MRGVEVTDGAVDFILFCVHSFVRPTTTLYALKHNDITVETDPKRLLVTVRNGKTGYRVANTMAGAVSAYERIRKRYPDVGGEDYLFLPDYPNRATASRIFQRQFNLLMERTELKHDPITDTERSVYSLRHTAICMRIILSHGKVNIFNLAKNAGTSVEQIERFYAKHLPLSREMAKNLQSFGGSKRSQFRHSGLPSVDDDWCVATNGRDGPKAVIARTRGNAQGAPSDVRPGRTARVREFQSL